MTLVVNEVIGSGAPEDFGKTIDAEDKRWGPMAHKVGIKPD